MVELELSEEPTFRQENLDVGVNVDEYNSPCRIAGFRDTHLLTMLITSNLDLPVIVCLCLEFCALPHKPAFATDKTIKIYCNEDDWKPAWGTTS